MGILVRAGMAALATMALMTTAHPAASAEPVQTSPVTVQEARLQCGADTVRVYTAPDGAGSWTGYVIHNGEYVNVIDHYNGVWWHINSPHPGWVLAQYFC